MNKTRLVWGAICLAVGLLLALLTGVLAPDQMMFMIGDANVPIVPAIILIILGMWLLMSARNDQEKSVAEKVPKITLDEEKVAMNKRLEGIGWGLFLIMLGGFSFVPHEIVSKGIWSIGVGLIMIGLNVARYFYRIKMSGFTSFLGILSLFGGIAQMFGMNELEGALFLIILGAYLILKPWFDKRQLFGKAA